MQRTALLLSLALAAGTALRAQGESEDAAFSAAEAALNRKAATVLANFGSFAQRNKVGPRAKEAYDLVLESYDSAHTSAMRALGYKKEKGEWVKPERALRKKVWKDEADDEQRFKVIARWAEDARTLAALHRERGLELLNDPSGRGQAIGMAHLRRAVAYDPLDQEAHLALGHVECKVGDTVYYGSAEQVAFIQRMTEIERYALGLAKKEYEVEEVEAIPEELTALGLEFNGAKTEHFTVFCRGAQRNATEAAQWAERGLDFLVFMLGDRAAKKLRVVERQRAWSWYAFLYTEREKERFVVENPGALQRARAAEAVKRFSNIGFLSKTGPGQVLTALTPAARADTMIGWVWQMGLTETNDALREGAMHAATWYMKATCETRFGALAEGTVSEDDVILPESTNWWLRAMRDQARAENDWPLNALPRVQLSSFENDARLKAWSFMTWCMARYPEKWLKLLIDAPHEKIPFPKEIDELIEKTLGATTPEVEAEWRGWAAGRDVTAAATGYGPPMLPEKPPAVCLEALERLNEVRAAAGWWNPKEQKWESGLPLCQHDAEASIACQEHAEYLALYPEQHEWPGAHEQDPAKEGFTPRGMRAAMRSVIVTTAGTLNVEGSIDGWMGVPYHRLSLLGYQNDRIGFGYDDTGEHEVMVLDVGSLPNPEIEVPAAFVIWPANDAKNVPVGFHAYESPHPLEEHGVDVSEQPAWGYPISLTMTPSVAKRLVGVGMNVVKIKGRAEAGSVVVAKHEPVPCWVHTPDEPLHSLHENRDTVFAIPKEHLRPNSTYGVVVKLTTIDGEQEFSWLFRTGSQRTGLRGLPKAR